MATAEKQETVAQLADSMSAAKAIFLADFTGMDVETVTEMRRKLRAASVDYKVVKNRLAKRAAEAAGLGGLVEYLTGPTAMAFAGEDPVESAKILQEYAGDNGKIAIKTGLFEGQFLTPDRVKEMASLPSHQELLSKLVYTVQSPLSGFAGILNGLLRNLVGALSAVQEKQAAAGTDAG